MSASHADPTRSNAAEISEDKAANDPLINPPDFDAPYEHAPPKDGDPWTTLLTPELEADTLRCNAWKDEVQNLLIFAGLFSAVVTAFVIESYKFLQPDPNDAVVGLLFHIASGLNNTSPFPPSISLGSILTPFSQTPSAIRINVFWFISLILSLTTVLVGTIALQWLREHQSYGGYSSKEKLAMLHMRSQAIKAWYLPQVFTMLPLLLQAALILFLAGLIEFSLPLGLKLTIPVSVIVGLTLLFLVATTILPSLQGLSFFCGLYPRKTLPNPCPFKSPQSHAFRKLLSVILFATFRSFPPPHVTPWGWITNRSLLVADHLAPSVRNLWYQSTWPALDREWLSLRDACHQRILDHNPDLYLHRTWWKDSLPLSDITQYLVEVASQTPGFKHTDSFLVALVHCFHELAVSIWTASVVDVTSSQESQRIDRHNNYFERIHSKSFESCSLSEFFLHGGAYKYDQLDENTLFFYLDDGDKQKLFYTDQTMIFLRILLKTQTSPALALYHHELQLRVLHLSADITPLIPATTSAAESILIPTIIDGSLIKSTLNSNLVPGQRYSIISVILTTLFKCAAVSQAQFAVPLLAHPKMPEVFDLFVDWTNNYLRLTLEHTSTNQHILQDIDDRLATLFRFITNHLNEDQPDLSSSSQKAALDIIFYLSSIFVSRLLNCFVPTREMLWNCDSRFSSGEALRSLLDALHKTYTSGERNTVIEKQFRGADYSERSELLERFSNAWWNEIFEYNTDNHPIIEQGALSSVDGNPVDTLLQVAIASDDTADTITNPFPATTSHGGLDKSPASDTQQLPTILDPPATTAKATGVVTKVPNSLPQSSLEGSDGTHHLGDNNTTPDTTIYYHLPPSNATCSPSEILHGNTMEKVMGCDADRFIPDTPHWAADADAGWLDVAPQQVMVNEAGPGDRDYLDPGDPHLSIDVDAPTVVDRVEVKITSSGGHYQQDETELDDAIVPIESRI